ncbi:LEE-encoded type III secretion system factor [Edwardsiella anguillarum]|uniref:Uncharacterized protein n=1 Tax=Edwardsiella anguillarum ET080813 TaxID=667120 RepID=A0A076LGZ6_9GAMM|nr:Hypothetical protein ETEE_1356 [Edwardsiella anguillarum ET080813]KAB0588218.1 hypothetical protein F7P84_16980 [Edwardsiella anguillarum]GAJ68513.1 putative LEE-encoded type III secretion system factor [Edwardsiella piscicida]BET82096.1 LEE-encoded type III secretion system factor [Edwardsiella anguillarum]BET85525.1 LEE-encoded type III secretion system factor [Edwardsiella anguillarum]
MISITLLEDIIIEDPEQSTSELIKTLEYEIEKNNHEMKMIKCNAEYKKRDKLNIAYLSAISTITTIKSRIKNEKNR